MPVQEIFKKLQARGVEHICFSAVNETATQSLAGRAATTCCEHRLWIRHDLHRRTPWLVGCSVLCLGFATAGASAASHQLWRGGTTGRPLPSGPPIWHRAPVQFAPPERAPSFDRRARHCSCKSGRFLHREREPPAIGQAQVASLEQRSRMPPGLALGRVVATGGASEDGHVLTSIAPRTSILTRSPICTAPKPAVGRVAAAGCREPPGIREV